MTAAATRDGQYRNLTRRGHNWLPRAGAFYGFIAMLVLSVGGLTAARAETRSLDIYHTHTGEHEVITFKRDGVYDQQGLAELNHILRDWRRNETIHMDPALFDLIWEVYRDAGAKGPIQIVCGYRSPETNNMLRERSRGVAKFSQHTLGKAMDFYLPGVPLEKLREVGMKKQIGGVGFYPTSGSPFVHMDTGGVRAWPRMTREQLVRLFPDGKTLHRPSDGPDLPGYNQAVAEYQHRRPNDATQVADAGSSSRSRGARNPISAFFGLKSGEDDEAETAQAQPPAEPKADSRPTAAAPVASASKPHSTAPLPAPQPPRATIASNLPHLAPKPIDDDVGPIRDQSTAPASQPAPMVMASLPLPRERPVASAGPAGPSVFQNASASLKPIAVPLPVARPQATGGPASRTRPPGATASPEARPIDAAYSALTGTPQEPGTDALLGYAPASTPAATHDVSTDARATSVSRDGSSHLRIASLGDSDATSLPPSAAEPWGKAARAASQSLAKADLLGKAQILSKADRADPLARLVSHVTDSTDSRFFTPDSAKRAAVIALFAHPDQAITLQLTNKPTEVIVDGFRADATQLGTDRFSGPAIVALAVITTR